MNKPELAPGATPQRLFDVPDVVPDGPISRLRGAGIEMDSRRLGRIFLAASLVILAVLAIGFFVVGLHKNAQINELHQHGVPVVVTANTCIGLMGGSGSNQAGYSCTGTFEVAGHRFTEAIPGLAKLVSGQKVKAVAASNGSGLFAPVGILAAERASWTVFIVPGVLALAFCALAGVLMLRQKKLTQQK